MADFGLFIGFGAPVQGRERQAIKVFNEVFEYYSRLQQEGEIESFERFFSRRTAGNSEASSSCAVTRTNSRASAPARSSSGTRCGASSSSRTLASWGQLWARASSLRCHCSRGRSKNSPNSHHFIRSRSLRGLEAERSVRTPGDRGESQIRDARSQGSPPGGIADVCSAVSQMASVQPGSAASPASRATRLSTLRVA